MNTSGEELKRGEHFYYTKNNSPIVMNSLISYSLTENCEQVTTLSHTCYTFQIWGISNRVDDDMKEFNPDYQDFKSILVSCKRRIM